MAVEVDVQRDRQRHRAEFGGAPSPVTLGGIAGWMASAFRGEQMPGRSGTAHLTLSHLFGAKPPVDLGLPAFFTDQADSYFLTDDRAVGATGSSPTSCRMNTRMDVVTGTRIFANAGGSLLNHCTISFISVPGPLASRLRGRICGDRPGS